MIVGARLFITAYQSVCGQAQIMARKGAAGQPASGAAEQPDSAKLPAPKEAVHEAARQADPVPTPPVTPARPDADAAQQDLLARAGPIASSRPGCKQGRAAAEAADKGPGARRNNAGKENLIEAASPAPAPITPTKRRLTQHLPGEAQRGSLCTHVLSCSRADALVAHAVRLNVTVRCRLQRLRAASGAELPCKHGRQH